jgi:hypothetical protein
MTKHGETRQTVLVRQMIFGQLLSRAVCTSAELGLSDLLADGPLTVADLAVRTGAHTRRLSQLMRCLAAFGRDRALRELFDRSQTHDQEWEIGQLLASVDFWEHRQIVDVVVHRLPTAVAAIDARPIVVNP